MLHNLDEYNWGQIVGGTGFGGMFFVGVVLTYFDNN
jgi:hypothetical protein